MKKIQLFTLLVSVFLLAGGCVNGSYHDYDSRHRPPPPQGHRPPPPQDHRPPSDQRPVLRPEHKPAPPPAAHPDQRPDRPHRRS